MSGSRAAHIVPIRLPCLAAGVPRLTAEPDVHVPVVTAPMLDDRPVAVGPSWVLEDGRELLVRHALLLRLLGEPLLDPAVHVDRLDIAGLEQLLDEEPRLLCVDVAVAGLVPEPFAVVA